MHVIDVTSYRKDIVHPLRHGYQARGNHAPSSIVIHTTNNRNKGTSFANEAEYLRDSAAVSAHFLIGKDGRIVQFLDPMRFQAWHAGAVLPDWANAKSIGIEHHVSVGEAWTDAQHAACTWLVRELMRVYGIPSDRVETHRAVATPTGRKTDPEGWSNADFLAWRATLMPPPPLAKRYRAKTCAPIFQSRDPAGVLAGAVTAGSIEQVDDLTNGWVHLSSGLGFSPVSCWELL